MLATAALTLVLVQFDVFKSRLPEFNSFFSAQNWLALAATLTATKILHEFGHGMSCKHFGGECHEMGVMFL
jgi:putative peptide zinc metalloprotease protein